MAALTGLSINKAFGKLATKREFLWFLFGTTTIIFCIALYSKPYPQRFKLQGTVVQSIFGGKAVPDGATGQVFGNNVPMAVLDVEIDNVGDDASVAKNFAVTANVGGQVFQGDNQLIPPTITLGATSGQSVTYYASDAMYQKMPFPIPPGGEIVGILLVTFP